MLSEKSTLQLGEVLIKGLLKILEEESDVNVEGIKVAFEIGGKEVPMSALINMYMENSEERCKLLDKLKTETNTPS